MEDQKKPENMMEVRVTSPKTSTARSKDSKKTTKAMKVVALGRHTEKLAKKLNANPGRAWTAHALAKAADCPLSIGYPTVERWRQNGILVTTEPPPGTPSNIVAIAEFFKVNPENGTLEILLDERKARIRLANASRRRLALKSAVNGP